MDDEQRVTVPLGGDDSPTYAELREYAAGIGLDIDSDVYGSAAMAVALLHDDPTAPWEATVTWRWAERRWTPVAVELRSRTGEPVTANAWRAVRPAAVIEDTRARLQWGHGATATHLAGRGEADAAEVVRRVGDGLTVEAPARPGRPPVYSDKHYWEVGAVYSRAKATASQRPVRAVARAFAERFPGVDGARDTRAKAWVREARRRGYIEAEG